MEMAGRGVFVLRKGGGALMLFHCHWTVKHRWEPYHVLTLSRDKTLYNKKKKNHIYSLSLRTKNTYLHLTAFSSRANFTRLCPPPEKKILFSAA